MNTDEDLLYRDAPEDEAAEPETFQVRRRELAELSVFFERDARRYDSGFAP